MYKRGLPCVDPPLPCGLPKQEGEEEELEGIRKADVWVYLCAMSPLL